MKWLIPLLLLLPTMAQAAPCYRQSYRHHHYQEVIYPNFYYAPSQDNQDNALLTKALELLVAKELNQSPQEYKAPPGYKLVPIEESEPEPSEHPLNAIIDKHGCLNCHKKGAQSGFDLTAELTPKDWTNVYFHVEKGLMPPGENKLTDEEVNTVGDYVNTLFKEKK